jgi:hypothetical protein
MQDGTVIFETVESSPANVLLGYAERYLFVTMGSSVVLRDVSVRRSPRSACSVRLLEMGRLSAVVAAVGAERSAAEDGENDAAGAVAVGGRRRWL